jgi:PAS domain S-box-containing protein
MKRSRLFRQYLLVSCCVAAVLIAENVMFLRELSAPSPRLAQIRVLLWVFTGLMVGVILFAGYVNVHIIAKRMNRLLQAIEEVREGKFPRLLVEGSDEMAMLIRGFNETVEEIRVRDEKLRNLAGQRESQVMELSRTLEQERERLGTLLNSVGDAIIVLDSANRVVMANQKVSEIFGMPTELLHSADLQTLIDQVRHRLISPETVDEKLRELRENADRVSEIALHLDSPYGQAIRLYCTPVRGPDGQLLGRIATSLDLGKERALERLKSEFISTISHELRTPLTSIKAGLGLIRGGATGSVPAEMRELLDIAVNNTDRLIRVINEILDLSQLERGQARMRPGPISVARCVVRAWNAVLPMAEARSITLQNRASEDLPPAEADATRVEQVLLNLFSNAIKFSAPGRPIVARAEARGPEIILAVQDFGRGMNQEFQSRLFQKFEHAEGALTREGQGMGLGLVICRHIVEAHHGRIWVQSAEGEGTTFFFSLPRAAGAGYDAAGAKAAPASEAGRLVLIVDDDPDVARVLAYAFESQGHRVMCARDGAQAVELALRYRPDILTLDLAATTADDQAVLQALRSARGTSGVPIICISSPGERGSPAGADFYLEKPIDIQELREVTERALAKIGEKAG